MLARVAASNTSSTPSIFNAEHSLYARAPIVCATRSACARVTYCEAFGAFGGGRRSDLHPTKITGIVGPHMDRTSSNHCYSDFHERTDSFCGEVITHLYCHVFQGIRGVDGESDENDMGFGVRHRSQTLHRRQHTATDSRTQRMMHLIFFLASERRISHRTSARK